VEELRLPISWVSRPFERDAREGAAPFRQQRRQYRARLLAHLYYSQHNRLCEDGLALGVEWEHNLAQQTLEAINAHRSRASEF
jgi:hypothetical protein